MAILFNFIIANFLRKLIYLENVSTLKNKSFIEKDLLKSVSKDY